MIWFLACSPNQESIFDISRPEAPALSLDEVEEISQRLLGWGIPHPLLIHEQYAHFMEQRSATCPQMENPNSDSWMGVWDDDCTTEDGYSYFGTALFGEDLIFDEHIDIWEFNILSSFELRDPQDNLFVAGGEILYKRERRNIGTTLNARIGGSYTYPEATGWLSKEGQASLFIEGSTENDTLTLELEGGMGVGNQALYFSSMKLAANICEGLPQGGIQIRDETGYWLDGYFTDCNPCATLYWHEETFGELCIANDLEDAMMELALQTL